MLRLPHHHVPRSALVARLVAWPVVVVEAPAGYGKSVLAAELADRLGVPAPLALLDRGDAGPVHLVARIAQGLRRHGLSDGASAVRHHGSDPEAAVDALVEQLEADREPTMLVLDDVHHATDAAGLLLRLARHLPDPHRLLVLGRRLPPDAGPLRREPSVVHLDSSELAFDLEQTGVLFREGFGIELSRAQVERIQRATAGWPAALVLVGHQLARGRSPAALELAGGRDRHSAVAALVRETLDGFDLPTREAVTQLAHLPMMDDEVATTATGCADLLARAVAAGVPLSPRRDGLWELPGPVREQLAKRAPLRAQTATAAASLYRRRGAVIEALHVLIRAGLTERAAALVADLSPSELDQLDPSDLPAIFAVLPPSALDAHPAALLRLAQAHRLASRIRVRDQLLDRAAEIAADGRDPALARAIEAERLRDATHLHPQHADVARRRIEELLDEIGDGEQATRARLLGGLGLVLTRTRPPGWADRAAALMIEAAAIHRTTDGPVLAAKALVDLAYSVETQLGRLEQAAAHLDAALELLGGRTRTRAVVLSYRAEALLSLGRLDDAERDLAEGRSLATLARDNRARAYVEWSAAKAASVRGDRHGTVLAARSAERYAGDWVDVLASGVTFAAEMADALSRVGAEGLARDFLRRARARRDEDRVSVLLAELAVEARSGDPGAAVGAFEALEPLLPRARPLDRARAEVLVALARARVGQADAAERAFAAFDRAAADGVLAPLAMFEYDAVAWFAPAGDPVACVASGAASAAEPSISITTLGGFAVTRAGQPVRLPSGRPTALVKLVAICGGRVPVTAAIDVLWPELDEHRGRERLRDVLHRLRRTIHVIERDEDRLVLVASVRVDAMRFEEESDRALQETDAHTRVALARSAVARYRGELLPDDLLAEWASVPRAHLRARALQLLDLIIDAARRSREVDEALRWIERSLDVDRYDERRYCTAAVLLATQGRRDGARRMLDRARGVLTGLGQAPSRALLDLDERLRA